MGGEPTPVLWLSGPCGAGKTTVAWEVFTRLVRSGAQGAYVDVDQLGMCRPERASDPGRVRLQAENLAAVVAAHRAAGAGYVVVSGVNVADLPDAAVIECRLRAEPGELSRRLRERPGDGPHSGSRTGTDGPDAGSRTGEGGASDPGAPVEEIDTTGRTVAEVADEVRRRIGAWPAPVGPGAPPPTTGDAGDRMLWLCGPTGVGKSTIGFQIFLRTLAAGVPAAYIDADQLAHAGPRPAGPALRAATVAAVWHGHRRCGARVAVVTGPAPHPLRYAGATIVRLHADPPDLTARILSRAGGGSWPQPGDPLRGRSEAYLRAFAAGAAREVGGPGLPVDTTGCSVAESVDLVLAATGWPSP